MTLVISLFLLFLEEDHAKRNSSNDDGRLAGGIKEGPPGLKGARVGEGVSEAAEHKDPRHLDQEVVGQRILRSGHE